MHNRGKISIISIIFSEMFLMKKFLCAFLLIALFSGSACADVNVGLLTQLNMSQAEFQTYMDAALSSGLWTMFTAGEKEPAIFVFYDSMIAMQMALNKGEVD